MVERRLEIFGEHTLDVSLLTPGGFVLDAGCRDFTFARGVAARGCRVIALDADPTVENPAIPGVAFANLALAAAPGQFDFVMHADPQARHLGGMKGTSGQFPHVAVEAMTIVQIGELHDVGRWDAVKLDIEGAEYDVLSVFPGPIASQISVEFHEHVSPRSPTLYDVIFGHLSKWYEVVQHQKEARYCCAANFWDTLWTLKSGAA